MDEWKTYNLDVHRKLLSIEQKIDDLMDRDADRRVAIAKLEIKSGLWGILGGSLSHFLHSIFKV